MMRTVLLCIAALVTSVGPATAADPAGHWLVADRTAIIDLAPCQGRLWGVISWEKTHGTDEYNANPALRGRPTLGMPIILGMQQTAADRWKGRVYDADDGKTYESTITIKQPDVLRIEGCVLGGVICSGENWTRVSASPANTGSVAKQDVCSHVTGGPGRAHERRLK